MAAGAAGKPDQRGAVLDESTVTGQAAIEHFHGFHGDAAAFRTALIVVLNFCSHGQQRAPCGLRLCGFVPDETEPAAANFRCVFLKRENVGLVNRRRFTIHGKLTHP